MPFRCVLPPVLRFFKVSASADDIAFSVRSPSIFLERNMVFIFRATVILLFLLRSEVFALGHTQNSFAHYSLEWLRQITFLRRKRFIENRPRFGHARLLDPTFRGGALSVSPSPFSDEPSCSNNNNNNSSNQRRNLIIGGILGALIGAPLAAEGYSRSARISDITGLADPEMGWDKVECATVVFHGAGGLDQYTDQLMKRLARHSKTDGTTYEAIVDWSTVSNNILQASFSGQRIGRRTAAELLFKAPMLKSLHLIGISVGAFAADSACTQAKELVAEKNSLFVQLTLLDPFTQRGVLDPTYGNRNFGRDADYAQQFLNSDDPVPSTNKPLSRCACVDVTGLRPADVFGHDWPLAYYARSGKCGLVNEADRQQPGSFLVASR